MLSKEKVTDAVARRFESLGLAVSRGGKADIAVHMEFESKAWPLGKKSIIYDALVWIDEDSATVSLREAVTETSSGLSIKAESETYSQRGTTLQRRIKGVFLGPDGQKRNYDFDLGTVSAALKEVAAQHGWSYITK